MKDTLSQQVAAGAGIPDWGTRLTVLLVALVALGVAGLLIYFKMKEADKRLAED